MRIDSVIRRAGRGAVPTVRTRQLEEGWYRILEAFSANPKHPDLLKHRLFLPRGEYRIVFNRGEVWYLIQYPNPDRGGALYVRLARTEPQGLPCLCPRLRFPHRRTDKCKGARRG